MVVVADTGPLQYLFLIGQIELLPLLYGDIVIPHGVSKELSHPNTPVAVRAWFGKRPIWLHVRSVTVSAEWPHLGLGEQEAISLGVQLSARLILMDDGAGRRVVGGLATPELRVTGTIGVLYLAAIERRFPKSIDMASSFDDSIANLRGTNFFFNAELDAAIAALSARLHQRETTFHT